MASNIFNSIRKSYSVHFLLTTVMTNIMVVGEPAITIISNHYNAEKTIVSYNSSGKKHIELSKVLENYHSDIDDHHAENKTQLNETYGRHNFVEANIYYSSQKFGSIGKNSEVDIENPHDNVFKVILPDVNLNEYEAVLEYELFGVSASSQTTKSINNNQAYGGEFIKKTEQWISVSEIIPTSQLTSGLNEVFFNRRKDAIYSYKVKNLGIKLTKSDKPAINILSQNFDVDNNKLYLSAVVNDSRIHKIKVLDKLVTVNNGVFETVIDQVNKDLEEFDVVLFDNNNNQKIYKNSLVNNLDSVDLYLEESYSANAKLFEQASLNQGCVSNLAINYTLKDYSLLTENTQLIIQGLPFKDVRIINEDIQNVTSGDFYGYRVRNNNLSKEGLAEIRLKYDLDKIPNGYGPKDVKTFFYDNQHNTWKALPTDEIDYDNQEIVTTISINQTDFINGVIQVPDSPEAASFAPTTISDIKYADPTSGIISIPPPTANSTGAVATSFPIKLPAGRNGMQPHLEVSYNSEGGNGWMGIGWNISTPAISLNTKWGAPRFDSSKESELYSLNGSDLVVKVGNVYTNPHRQNSISRIAGTREFYVRKEGSYNKIIRHGNNPTEYWWEVIDKQGNKTYYGANHLTNSIVEESVMRDASGNIGHWGITYIVDLYGNFIEYEYDKGQSTAMFGSVLPTQYQYLESIKYTLKVGENLNNYYKIDFKRINYDIPSYTSSLRYDKIVNAKNGYIQSIDDRLTQIAVSFVDQGVIKKIRTYRFGYQSSLLQKTLLNEIAEYDSNNNLFYKNTLTYYSHDSNDNLLLNGNTTWSGGNDVIGNDLFGLSTAIQNLIPRGSALGTSTSSGYSFGIRLGVGIGSNSSNINNTIGGGISYSKENSSGKISFIDLNGDGLPDKVFQFDGAISYRPNTGQGFGGSLGIGGINKLSNTSSKTNGSSIDASFSIVGIGKSWSRTSSVTDNYFEDFNGDGLPDYAINNQVIFNTTSTSNNPDHNTEKRAFVGNVNLTDNKINGSQLDSTMLDDIYFPELNHLRAEFPQFDHVKVWTAPFSGEISITGNAVLLEKFLNQDQNNVNYSNNFRFTIEKVLKNQNSGPALSLLRTGGNDGTILSNTNINNPLSLVPNYNTVNNTSRVQVSQGDKIFFRIHNLQYGSGGKVKWNPIIKYCSITNNSLPPLGTNNCTVGSSVTDENGELMYQYSALDNFIYNNGNGIGIDPEHNQITFNFNLPTLSAFQFSDDVKFHFDLKRYSRETGEESGSSSYHRNWNHDLNSITGTPNTTVLNLNHDDYFYVADCYVSSTSNVKWNDIIWQPKITYNVDNYVYDVPVRYKTYDVNVNSNKYWFNYTDLVEPIFDPNIPNDGNTNFMVISNDIFNSGYAGFLSGFLEHQVPIKINWVVKVKYNNGQVSTLNTKTFILERGNPLVFLSQITYPNYSFKNENGITINPSNYESWSTYNLKKQQVKDIIDNQGTIYSAFYVSTPKMGAANRSIKLNLLPTQQTNPPTYNFQEKTLDKPFFSHNEDFYGYTYRGWGEFLYNGGLFYQYDEDGIPIENSKQDFSNLIDMSALVAADQDANEDDYAEPDPEDLEGMTNNPIRISMYFQEGYNTYKNKSIINSEYKLSDPNELRTTLGRFGEPNIYQIYVDSDNIASPDPNIFLGLKQYSMSKGSAITGNINIPVGGSTSLGASGTSSEGYSKILNQFVDLNGDGYPDLVTEGKVQFTNMLGALNPSNVKTKSALKLDNLTTGEDNEDFIIGVTQATIISNSTSDTSNVSSSDGQKTNKTNTNVQSGINPSKGSSKNLRLWVDINGDGLTDHVTITNNAIRVRLNLGYKFSEEDINWLGNTNGFSETSSRSNVSVSGSIGSDLELPENIETGNTDGPKGDQSFAFGFGASISSSMNNVSLVDVNGDGLVDLVYHSSGGVYRYKLNLGNKFSNSHNVLTQKPTYLSRTLAGNVFGTATAGFIIPLPFIVLKVVGTASLGVNASISQTTATLQDINGDGYVDLLHKKQSSSNSDISVNLNKLNKTHLLKEVKTPLGGSWIIDYARTGNTYDMPQSKWVLSSVETNDGFADDNFLRPDKTITRFEYANPKYDRREREFFGFGEVKTLQYLNFSSPANSPYRYVISNYHNNNYYTSGLQKSTQTFNGADQLLSEQLTYYNLLNPDTPLVSVDAALYSENGIYTQVPESELDRSRIFVAPVMITSKTFENGSYITAEKKSLEYDNLGNLLAHYDKGEGGNDGCFTRIDYYSEQELGIINGIGYPKEISLYQNNEQGPLLRKRNAEYNSQGKLDKISVTVNTDNDQNETSFKYDNYGNVIEIKQLNNVSEINSGSYYVSINYDNKVHTYPVRTSNAFGEVSYATYNYWFGIPLLTTDNNNQNMRTRIDSRGRIIEVTGPNEYPSGWTIRMDYKGQNLPTSLTQDVFPATGNFDPSTSGSGTAHAITRHFDPEISGNQFLTVSIVDGFGSPIQLKKSHQVGNTMGWLINSFDRQDGLGRTTHTYLPNFVSTNFPTNFNNLSASGVYSPLTMGYHLTYTKYDHRDRPTHINEVDAENSNTYHTSTISYDIEDSMFKQQITNAKGYISKVYSDVRGRQRKTVQVLSGSGGDEEINTYFTYNAINEKIKVRNHFGYVTEYKYDMAGQRIEELSPDRGVSQFKYDFAGRLVASLNSNLLLLEGNNNHIEYKYDFGRLIEVNYPQNPQNNVTYIYGNSGDQAAITNNAVGRLLRQEDASGVQLFKYGKMGEFTANLRSVAVPGYQSYWFLTRWEYDSWNRVKNIKYPDGEDVRYQYNQAGMLESITSSSPDYQLVIVRNIIYNQYGERSRIEYGNGTFTDYSYNNRMNMNNLIHNFKTGNSSNSEYQIQKNYEYDELSNIARITTSNPDVLLGVISENGLIGGAITHSYEYDSLNRLVYADGEYVGANDFPGSPYLKHAYELNMEYNHDHTILSKTQTHVQGMVDNYLGAMNAEVVMPKTNYHLRYSGYATGSDIIGDDYYGIQQPHAPREIVEYHNDQENLEDPRTRFKKIKYDANGNQLVISETLGDEETLLRINVWDEENRLKAVDLKPSEHSKPIAIYTYDASGERIIRYNYDNMDAKSNASHIGRSSRDNIMIYPSGLVMAKVHKYLSIPNSKSILTYTKHYYIGSERVGAKTGTYDHMGYFMPVFFEDLFGLDIHEAYNSSKNRQVDAKELVENIHVYFEVNPPVITDENLVYSNGVEIGSGHNLKNLNQFYFHPDHLGSSSYITNQSGMVSQHIEYLPFGELLVDEHTNSYNSPFKYNGKEFDEETGNYYYSARYYDPKWSIFVSVDPLAELAPDWTPYRYGFNNPIMFTDPTGMFETAGDGGENTYIIYKRGEQVLETVHVDNEGGDDVDFITEVDLDKVDALDPSAVKKSFVSVKKTEESTVPTPYSFQAGEDTGQGFRVPGHKHVVKYKGVSQAIQPMDLDSPFFMFTGLFKNLIFKSTVNTAAKGGIQLTKKTFGHTFTTHGDDMTNFLINRAKGSGMAQGQFLNNQKAAQFILDNVGKTANGAVNIPIPKGFPARVIMPDGTFKAATHIRLIPGGGGVKTAYPLIP